MSIETNNNAPIKVELKNSQESVKKIPELSEAERTSLLSYLRKKYENKKNVVIEITYDKLDKLKKILDEQDSTSVEESEQLDSINFYENTLWENFLPQSEQQTETILSKFESIEQYKEFLSWLENIGETYLFWPKGPFEWQEYSSSEKKNMTHGFILSVVEKLQSIGNVGEVKQKISEITQILTNPTKISTVWGYLKGNISGGSSSVDFLDRTKEVATILSNNADISFSSAQHAKALFDYVMWSGGISEKKIRSITTPSDTNLEKLGGAFIDMIPKNAKKATDFVAALGKISANARETYDKVQEKLKDAVLTNSDSFSLLLEMNKHISEVPVLWGLLKFILGLVSGILWIENLEDFLKNGSIEKAKKSISLALKINTEGKVGQGNLKGISLDMKSFLTTSAGKPDTKTLATIKKFAGKNTDTGKFFDGLFEQDSEFQKFSTQTQEQLWFSVIVSEKKFHYQHFATTLELFNTYKNSGKNIETFVGEKADAQKEQERLVAWFNTTENIEVPQKEHFEITDEKIEITFKHQDTFFQAILLGNKFFLRKNGEQVHYNVDSSLFEQLQNFQGKLQNEAKASDFQEGILAQSYGKLWQTIQQTLLEGYKSHAGLKNQIASLFLTGTEINKKSEVSLTFKDTPLTFTRVQDKSTETTDDKPEKISDLYDDGEKVTGKIGKTDFSLSYGKDKLTFNFGKTKYELNITNRPDWISNRGQFEFDSTKNTIENNKYEVNIHIADVLAQAQENEKNNLNVIRLSSKDPFFSAQLERVS